MSVNDYAPTLTGSATVMSGVEPAAGQQSIRLGKLFAIADQIQALCLARKTAEIRVTNVVPPGKINIVQGEVVHGQFGGEVGVDAVITMINLADPESEIVPDHPTLSHSITLPYPQILLEAANRKDENSITRYRVDEARLGPHNPVLWVILGPRSTDCPLPLGLTLVGRSSLSDIIIPDPTVSKRHACIQVSEGEVVLRDLHTTNGTYVEGRRIEEATISGRVRLRFGNVSAVLTVPIVGDPPH